MKKWDELADEKSIGKTVDSLRENGMEVFVVDSGKEARKKILEILPKDAEVMTMSSTTLDTIGISKDIAESRSFNSVRKKFMSMDKNTQGSEMKKMGAAPEWAVGSAHAVTEDGKILVASATGSQLPAYAYGANHVIWVIGTQKIVENLDDGMDRIYKYTLPLEDARARKAYGVGSGVNKLLIINKETAKGRITMIFVKEKLGF